MKTLLLITLLTASTAFAQEETKQEVKHSVSFSILNSPNSSSTGSLSSGATSYSGTLLYGFGTSYALAHEAELKVDGAWSHSVRTEYVKLTFKDYNASAKPIFAQGAVDGSMSGLNVSYVGRYQFDNGLYMPLQAGYTLLNSNDSSAQFGKTAKMQSVLGLGLGGKIADNIKLEGSYKQYGIAIDTITDSGVTAKINDGYVQSLVLTVIYGF